MTIMADTDKTELLFFDTFSHENTEELNLDLVKFPFPVILSEVHVVPLGTKVQIDVPGGTRMGATNPSSFNLELFVNNLRKPNVATFEKLGVLEYKQNKDVYFKLEHGIPTNGLILKGWYNTITIAVFGSSTTNDSSPPPPPPPLPQQPTHRAKPTAAENRTQGLSEKHSEWEPRQHPFDYIKQQVEQRLHFQHLQQQQQKQQQQQQQQQVQQHPLPHPLPHPPPPPQPQVLPPRPDVYRTNEELFDPRHPPPPVSREMPSEYGHNTRDFSGSSRDNYPVSREPPVDNREPYQEYPDFPPPEPKTPYNNHDFYEETRNRNNYEREHHREARSHNNLRDSDNRDYVSSRENARETKETVRDNSKEQRPRSPPRYKERERDRTRDYSERDPRIKPASPPRSRSPRSPLPPPRKVTPPRPPEEEPDAGETPNESTEDIYNLTPENSPQAMFSLSDAENQEVDDGYEDITSDDDDDLIGMEETDLQNVDYYDGTDDSWNYATSSFNPFQCYLALLTTFTDPSLTQFEIEKSRWQHSTGTEMPSDAKTLLEIVEQFVDKEHHEKWVEALESVPALLPAGFSFLLYKEDRKDILDTLVSWALEGVDLEKAIAQPETAYKVRHLKMGIHLTGSLCNCDSMIALKLITKDVQHQLLDLYVSPNMSVSLKLQIFRALDQTTRFQDGILWFLGDHTLQKSAGTSLDKDVEQTENGLEDNMEATTNLRGQSCYCRLVELMMIKQMVRAAVGGTALLRKIHTCEVLKKFTQVVEKVVDSMPNLEEVESLKPTEEVDGSDTDMDPLIANVQNLSDVDAELLITCLEEITKVMARASDLIAQPRRASPGKVIFEIRQPPCNPYPNLYRMCDSSQLLECLFILMSSPVTANHPGLFVAVREFFQQLIETQHGLLFLNSKPEATNGILRALVQMGDYNREEGADENPAQQLGLELIYNLQTLQYVDQLIEYHKKATPEKDIDDAEPLGILHSLYSMTVATLGRDSVVHVLSLDNNLKSLLPFVELSGDEHKDGRIKKSVCAGYVSELLLLVIQQSENMEMLEKFSQRLLTISEDGVSTKLIELQEWLAPTRKVSAYSHEGLQALIFLLKQHTEEFLKFPKGLITTVRILKNLSVAPELKYPKETAEELKYKYVLVELFSAECFPILVGFLQKISDSLLRPWQQGIPQSSNHLFLMQAIVKPTLCIIKATLSLLIMARSAEFRDLTTLPVLFELHTVLCSIPTAAFYTLDIQQIQKCIIDTLAAYTQPAIQSSESDEALSQSLWTLMLKELLKHTLSSPYRYLSGLLVLSELLPLPLPTQTREPLTNEEVAVTITNRKLWSAHLHPLSPQIHEVIQTLAGSSCQPLQNVLRRLCWQLSDLAAPTATMVTRCILEILQDSLSLPAGGKDKTEDKKEVEKETKEEVEEEKYNPSYTSKILNLLMHLLSQPAIKSAMLCLMRAGPAGDEKTHELLSQILQLLNTVSDKPVHIQIQEWIVSILQNLCDLDITLVPGDTCQDQVDDGVVTKDGKLSNSLPDHDSLTMIIQALLEHIGNREHTYTSVTPCIRTLVMLLEHDYGFYYVKCTLQKNNTIFHSLLSRINETYCKDSTECLTALSTTLEFLRMLGTIEPNEDDVSLLRTFMLTTQELRHVLSWTMGSNYHPLYDLEKLLEECTKEEETLDSLLDSMSALNQLLMDKTESCNTSKEATEPSLCVPESLSFLFNQRVIYMLSDPDDEHLTANFWLPNPITEDPDLEPDLVRCDLEDLCQKYCSEFSLEEELQKGTVAPYEGPPKPKRPRARRKSHEGLHIPRGKGTRKPFPSPMRGRGMSRGVTNSGRSDPFRSRPPNTSRPPSMHVDDFVKLQSFSQPTGPTGITRRSDKEPNRGRGRGFDRNQNFSGRGRFFNSQGNYSRRDGGQFAHGPKTPLSYYPNSPRGGGMNVYGSRTNSSFNSPRPFIRGGLDKRPSSLDRRTGRDSRFSPRGGGGGRGSGSWFESKVKDQDMRFTPPSFRGRRETGRHFRSFTK